MDKRYSWEVGNLIDIYGNEKKAVHVRILANMYYVYCFIGLSHESLM